MTQFQAKRIRFKNGERHSVLLCSNGKPVHEATLFLLRLRTKGLASKTIHTVCISISIVHNKLNGLDLVARFKTGQFLTSAELARLEMEAQYWVADLSEDETPRANSKVISLHTVHPKSRSTVRERDQVDLPTRAARLRYIEFLTQYVGSTLPVKLSSELASKAQQGLASFRANIPIVSNRAKVGARTGLSEEEQDLLLATVHPDSEKNPWQRGFVRTRNWIVVVVLLATGMRRGELLGLQISDLSPSTPHLDILRRADDPNDPRSEEPNTKTRERRVELSPSIMRALWRYINVDRYANKAARKHQYVIVADDGAPLSLSSVDKMFQQLRKACPDLPKDLTSHVMRHTWNERFSEQAEALGVSPEMEQRARNEQQGWTDDSKTSTQYTRRYTSRKGREIALKIQERLDDIVNKDK